MKKLTSWTALVLCVALTLAIVAIPAFAAGKSDYCLADLMFSTDTNKGVLTLDGAKIVDVDSVTGAVTVELTKATANIKMVFAEGIYKEGDSGTIYSGDAIDCSDPNNLPYFAYDYASADGVTIGQMIAHYTRADKAAKDPAALADLWLVSMESSDYADHSKLSGTGYGVWEWGRYVNEKGENGIIAGGNRFCDVECVLNGSVGKRIVFYTFGVYSTYDNDKLGLGTVRPEPTPEPEVSEPEVSDEPVEIELPENAVEGTVLTAVSINTAIVEQSMTVVTDLSKVSTLNLRWTLNVLLAPNDNGSYTIASITTGEGSDPVFEDAGEGYIVLAIHGGDGNDPDCDAFKLKATWSTLATGTNVVFSGYDFAAGTVAEGAYVCAVEGEAPVVSDDPSEDESTEQPSEDPSEDESTEESVEESTGDESKDTSESESNLTWLWIVIAVVVVAAVVVVVVLVSKKKKN